MKLVIEYLDTELQSEDNGAVSSNVWKKITAHLEHHMSNNKSLSEMKKIKIKIFPQPKGERISQ